MAEIGDIEKFSAHSGVVFVNQTLLRTAFTHRSYLNENKSDARTGEIYEHNERLEFLGDAVLELVVTEFLFAKYPLKPEGELTAIRAALVNTVSISEAAKSLHMNDFLLLSRGEAKDNGRARDVILANTYESFLGALYIDQGYIVSRDFIARTLFGKLDAVVEQKLWQDPKSRFQEMAQEIHSITPTYRVLREQGPDHDKQFVSGIFIGDTQIAEGVGKSKQEAETAAARKGLEAKGW
ncbi:MAG: ribonuclease III [Minisyncoccia bacterium]